MYPDLDLEDKVSQKEGGNVRRTLNESNEKGLEIEDNELHEAFGPLTDHVYESDTFGRGKRKKKGNPWLRDFVSK